MCESCGDRREVLQKHGDPPPVCQQCKYEMKKQISVTSFSLQGDGWAKDNYGLKNG
jgi:putative FmdB family regulatory protein|tara:strand:- start:656 stop:823 length:168 start_codon:yes stop_codon:yes gene_type:complete